MGALVAYPSSRLWQKACPQSSGHCILSAGSLTSKELIRLTNGPLGEPDRGGVGAERMDSLPTKGGLPV